MSAPGRRDDAETDAGIRVSGLRIGIDLESQVVGDVVHDGETGDVPLVALEEGDPAAVGAPPVGEEVAAPVDLLLIDPIELPVQEVGSAPGGEPEVAAREIHDVEVVVADEGDPVPVR